MEPGLQTIEPQQLPATQSQPVAEALLRRNWGRILAQNSHERGMYVRVLNGVANVAIVDGRAHHYYSTGNSPLLVRTVLHGVMDGFYTLSDDDRLIRHDYPGRWMDFPDFEACQPDFSKLTPSPPITNEAVHYLIRFCEDVRKVEGWLVFDKSGIYMRQNSQIAFQFGFELPLRGEPFYVDPTHLKLAAMEMLRYDAIYLSMEYRPERVTPLVLGLDWGHCALLMPKRAGH